MGRAGKRSVRFRTSFSNTIYDVMTSRNWKETDSETDWDVHWAEREWVYEVFDTMHLEPHQRINHFRNGRELCRKDLLVKNLKRMKRNLQRDGQLEQARAYDFMPLSFVLPREYAMFVEEFKRCGGVWIMKPIGSAQGRGIFLFSRLSEISEWRTDPRHLQRDGGDRDSQRAEPEAYIVQRYIENPYLVGGKKFDIRLYVLVTSFSPLVAFMYRGGFARFSHTRYSSDPADIANNFVHLTNVAIQKTAENYDARSGGKKDLRSLKLLLATQHGMAAVDQLFLAIERVIVRSLIAVQHVMIADKHCFELYGYDVRFFRVPWRPAAPALSPARSLGPHRRRAQAVAHRGQRVAVAHGEHEGRLHPQVRDAQRHARYRRRRGQAQRRRALRRRLRPRLRRRHRRARPRGVPLLDEARHLHRAPGRPGEAREGVRFWGLIFVSGFACAVGGVCVRRMRVGESCLALASSSRRACPRRPSRSGIWSS